MNKNYMDKVAELLGLELGDEFALEKAPEHSIYRISADGIEVYHKEECYWEVLPQMLAHLLTGKERIIKMPWKPAEGERYYEPIIDNFLGRACFTCWSGSEYDNYRYENGLVFRTEEEAIEMAKIMQTVAKKKVFGIL